MEKTPNGNRKFIGIFGETNSGKSTLFNKILNTDLAIVSEIKGTTTDPVQKAVELIPFGPIVLIDTPGLGDDTELGHKRMKKTMEVLDKVDFAIYVLDGNDYDKQLFYHMENNFKKKNISYIVTINKCIDSKIDVKNKINISTLDNKSIENFKNELVKKLRELDTKEIELMEGILDKDSVVIMVTPIDSAAPKGRLILPQVQVIRSCLDFGIRCHITDEKGLDKALRELKKVDLVVTDSQMFKIVDEIVPVNIPLTSFSILFARQKGNIKTLVRGASIIDQLNNGDKVLISEVCTHNVTHEDIGRIKIPEILKKYTKKNINFDFVNGKDYPENLSEYKLIVHCGGCMITPTQMKNRIEKSVPITNYGILIAYCNGILNRSIEVLNIDEVKQCIN